MPTIEAEFEVFCACGNGLCSNTSDSTVEPCEKCLERARDEGYREGYDEGYDEGRGE